MPRPRGLRHLWRHVGNVHDQFDNAMASEDVCKRCGIKRRRFGESANVVFIDDLGTRCRYNERGPNFPVTCVRPMTVPYATLDVEAKSQYALGLADGENRSVIATLAFIRGAAADLRSFAFGDHAKTDVMGPRVWIRMSEALVSVANRIECGEHRKVDA